MKLILSDPVVVAMGPESENGGWGTYQFPDIYKIDDGRLVYTFSNSIDSERAYGSKPGCRVSNDSGATWKHAEVDDFRGQLGVKLPNGDILAPKTCRSIPLNETVLPQRIGTTWLGHTIYSMDDVKMLVPQWTDAGRSMWHDSWIFTRSNEKYPDGVDEKCRLNWPYFPVRSCQGVLVPPSPRGRLRIAPDGTLWMPHYYLAGTDPESGAYNAYLCNYLFRSTDYGHEWDLVSWLEYTPDNRSDPLAYAYEGYGENDITFCPDGTMTRLIRMDGCYPRKGPTYIVHSTDGGFTWTYPEVFDDHGVYPCLLTLKCGVTLASYGRPGFGIRATTDPACRKWEAMIEFVHSNGKTETKEGSVLNNATCGYSNMIALNDHTAAVAYSDFTVKDFEGIPHKCLMYRTVTVG